jgi:hypothetical protein
VLLEQQGAAACPRETHVETVNANSPSVSSTDIWIYIALGAADVFLMLRYARRGLDQGDRGDAAASPRL